MTYLYLFILCICKLRRFFNDEAILSIAYITYYLKKKKDIYIFCLHAGDGG